MKRRDVIVIVAAVSALAGLLYLVYLPWPRMLHLRWLSMRQRELAALAVRVRDHAREHGQVWPASLLELKATGIVSDSDLDFWDEEGGVQVRREYRGGGSMPARAAVFVETYQPPKDGKAILAVADGSTYCEPENRIEEAISFYLRKNTGAP